MASFALRFDLRNRPGGPTDNASLYRACLEACAWGDRLGATFVAISEHHGADDGYLPAPLALAGLIAGRTERLAIVVAALIAPLNDPVRVAEQLVVLDLASQGRVSVVLGAGYRPEEFAMYGVDRSRRGELVEEFATVLRQAFTGQPFEWRGRTIRVTPRPLSEPHPPIFIGGSAPVSARRAARLGLGFFPSVGEPELARIYHEECARQGTEAMVALPSGPGFVHVSEDPERDWARLAPYILHDANVYASVKKSGVYRVVTPEECLALAGELGDGAILLHPLLGGMPQELGFESLDLFERRVLPHLAPTSARDAGSMS